MSDPEKTGQAKALRRRTTVAERILWSKIRAARVYGLKFKRQEPIDVYIVDFYCSTARLVIELDGDAHFFRKSYDLQRQTYLEAQGITVVRFPNDVVVNDIGVVLNRIYRLCEGHIEPNSKG